MADPTLRELAHAYVDAEDDESSMDAMRATVARGLALAAALGTPNSIPRVELVRAILAALDAERAAGRAEVLATVERLTRESVERYYADRSERHDAASDACDALCEAVRHEWG